MSSPDESDVYKDANDASGLAADASGALESGTIPPSNGSLPGTPLRRRLVRPARDSVTFYGTVSTPKTPKVLPIFNQNPKEKLELNLPAYRKTDRILLFESKTFGQARYVDKAMMNVGYQANGMSTTQGSNRILIDRPSPVSYLV